MFEPKFADSAHARFALDDEPTLRLSPPDRADTVRTPKPARRRAFLPLTILLGVLLGVAGALFTAQGSPDRQARAWVDGGALLVDVRTPGEYRAGHLPEAINIPLDEMTAHFDELGDPDRPIVVYCKTGGRSAEAVRFLETWGYSKVLDLGSIDDWTD